MVAIAPTGFRGNLWEFRKRRTLHRLRRNKRTDSIAPPRPGRLYAGLPPTAPAHARPRRARRDLLRGGLGRRKAPAAKPLTGMFGDQEREQLLGLLQLPR